MEICEFSEKEFKIVILRELSGFGTQTSQQTQESNV